MNARTEENDAPSASERDGFVVAMRGERNPRSLWETTSEGSPTSPVFPTAEALAEWCAENASYFADLKMSKEEWLRGFVNDTTDVDSLLVTTRVES